jgi:hypothetical protein
MDSLKITNMIGKSKSEKNNSIPQKTKHLEIPMLPIRDIIITSVGLGIPWLVLLILCAILIFI